VYAEAVANATLHACTQKGWPSSLCGNSLAMAARSKSSPHLRLHQTTVAPTMPAHQYTIMPTEYARVICSRLDQLESGICCDARIVAGDGPASV